MANYDPAWIITGPVMVTGVTGDPARVQVKDAAPDAAGGYRQCELRYADGKLTFSTVFVDVGDDFMAYLAVMDAASEAEPGEWVRSEPYDNGDDRYPEHDCAKQQFLDDPITRAYGVGSEMVGLIPCPVRVARGE